MTKLRPFCSAYLTAAWDELRGLLRSVVEDGYVDLLAERLQLGDSGGPIRVGGNQQGLVAHLADMHGQLAGMRRLARALQTHE